MSREILFSSEDLSARVLGAGDEKTLQRVFEAGGDYFLPITGRPAPDVDAAEREIRSMEANPGRHAALLVRKEDESPVGVIGWWEGSPEPDVALLGMLLLVPEARGKGLGRQALGALEGVLVGRGIRRLRTGVGAHDVDRQALVHALGFSGLDERTHVSLDRGRMMIGLYEKRIGADA